MKKTLKTLAVTTMLVVACCMPVQADANIRIYLNGTEVQSQAKPVIIDGYTFIPLRPVAEKMGLSIYWNAEKKAAAIYSSNTVVTMVVNEKVMNVFDSSVTPAANTPKQLDKTPTIINGSCYIPMRAMTEAFGAKVEWDGALKQVHITYNGEKSAGTSKTTTDTNKTTTKMTTKTTTSTATRSPEADEAIKSMAQPPLDCDTWTEDGVGYVGYKVNGKISGYGEAVYGNGYYIGDFKNGKADGYGLYVWTHGTYAGDVYAGNWKNGNQEGEGTYWFGHGQYVGDSYKGEWKNGNKDGYGEYTDVSYGVIMKGQWSNGDTVDGKIEFEKY